MNGKRRQELGWVLLVMAANFVLFAGHAWALGQGLPGGDIQPVIRCAYFDGKDQDPTAFATEKACHAFHEQCVKSCSVSSYSCVSQGTRSGGRSCREAGLSEISEADARSRAVTACLASGATNCQVLNCLEDKREVSPL